MFIRRYIEMVIAMFLGMVVLGLPAEGALRALGTSTSELQVDAPAPVLLDMAVIMTVPMVAWMRRRARVAPLPGDGGLDVRPDLRRHRP